MNADAVKAARKEAKRMFTRTVNKSKQMLAGHPALKTLERRMEELAEKWNEVQKKHETYMTSLGEGANEQEEDKYVDEIDVRYYELEALMDKKIEEIMKEKKDNELKNEENKAVIQNPPQQINMIKIEHLKFKSFDGEIRSFPRFKEEFFKYIKPMCSKEQLPLVLKSYLIDKVREEVENIGDDINEIWARLDKKYGDQGRLIDTILADVKGVPSCKHDDQATLNMIKVVERAHCDLKRMGKEAEMENTTIISMLEEKMSDEMGNEWIKIVTKDENRHKNKFALLNKLLLEFRDRIEYKLANIRMVCEDRYAAHHVNLQNSVIKKSQCWLHKINGDHPIWRCRLFLSKSVSERIELVKQNRACYSCLDLGHTGGDCKRGFVCTEPGCKRSRNRLLHEFVFEQKTNYKSTVLPNQ